MSILQTPLPDELFGFENYLHILSDFNQRKSFTKFRISNHKLKIETGRYSKPLENRIREKCFSDEIESEEHLLLKCSFYSTSRRKLLETIKNNKLIILTLKNYHLGINLYGF